MVWTERVDSPSIEELMVYPFNRIELRMAEAGVKRRSAAERDAIAEMVRTRGAAYAARFRHAAELSWRMPELYWTAEDDGRMTIDHMDAIWRRLDRHPDLRAWIDQRQERARQREAEYEAEYEAQIQAQYEAKNGASETPDEGICQEPPYSSGDWQECYDGTCRGTRKPTEAENVFSASADMAVEQAVVEWLRESPHRLITETGTTAIRPRSTVTIHRLREVVDTAVVENLEMHRRYEHEE
jgi:hypothetical protein